jgi:hypothetical protein
MSDAASKRTRRRSTHTEPALHSEVLLSFPGGQEPLASVVAQVPFAPYAPRGEVRLEVLLTTASSRVTLRERDRPASTFVSQAGSEVAIWDHESSTWWSAPGSVAPLKVQPADRLTVKQSRAGGARRTILGLSDATLGSVKTELEFDADPRWQPFALSFLSLLFGGPLCHAESGVPIQRLSRQGLITGARGFIGERPDPVMTLAVSGAAVLRVGPDSFTPPPGFERKSPLTWESGSQHRRRAGSPNATGSGPPWRASRPSSGATQSGQVRGVTPERRIVSPEHLTPECEVSSRGGDIAMSVHQDLLDGIHNAVNMAGSLLGTGTLNDGKISVPWLANLEAIANASATAPGSGLFALLRDAPRVAATGNIPASGGTGLLDVIAVMLERNKPGFSSLSISAQIPILEAVEDNQLGVVSISGLPKTLGTGSTPWKKLVIANVVNISGTADFSTLPAFPKGMINTAAIGANGDIQLDVRIPDIHLRGTLACALTPLGLAAVGVATTAACILMPWTCPAAILLATVLWTILDQITRIEIGSSDVGLALDISYQWDAASSVLKPQVTTNATSGTIDIISTWSSGGAMATLIDDFFLVVGDLFNLWLAVLVEVLPGALESFLAAHASFPPGLSNLTANAGWSSSAQNSVLTLAASLQPNGKLPVGPYVTQVDSLPKVASTLQNDLVLLEETLNPPPTGGTPGPGVGKALSSATYLAVSASQNVLNYYLFEQWAEEAFNIKITDAQTIDAIMSELSSTLPSLPPPDEINIWPATPPRVEVAMISIAHNKRPLVAFFDDVRACFRFGSKISKGTSPAIEFSFNFKTTATIGPAWPAIFKLYLDDTATPSEALDFELVVAGEPTVMVGLAASALTPLADKLAAELIAPLSAAAITAPAGPPALWARNMPNVQQTLLSPAIPGVGEPQLDMLAHRRILYCFPELLDASIILELIDASGGPLLSSSLGISTPVNLVTITKAQGETLRTQLALFLPAVDYIPG